jgi:predicted nucleic-acid-binding protein
MPVKNFVDTNVLIDALASEDIVKGAAFDFRRNC